MVSAERSGHHDTLVRRLTQILVKLNRGESLDPRRLAEEFSVDLRTVQRDLNQRFAYLDLVKSDGKYRIDPMVLGTLSTKDIERFATFAGTGGLFPSMSHSFVRSLLTEGPDLSMLVRGHHYEDISGRGEPFMLIRQAIAEHRRLSFEFEALHGTATKTFADVEPYKLINQRGIWYLAAVTQGKLKTFGFTRIRAARMEVESFTQSPAVLARVHEDEGIWQSDDPVTVVIQVAASVAPYFRRRKLIANQAIEPVADDGSLVISTTVGHPMQVVPIVRYWIPHLRIVEPLAWQQTLELELRRYAAPAETTPPVVSPD